MAGALPPVSGEIFWYLSSDDSVACLCYPPLVSLLLMGRRPWTTDKQLEFFHSYTPGLTKAKAETGLNVYYVQIAQDFLTHWEAEPITAPVALDPSFPKIKTDPKLLTPEQLDHFAKVRVQSVCFIFIYVFHH